MFYTRIIRYIRFYKVTKEAHKMYIFNKIKVNPQLPEKITHLSTIANNLWWSWNSEFLKIIYSVDNYCKLGCTPCDIQYIYAAHLLYT